MVIVLRSAASWLPKMKKVAYNGQLDAASPKATMAAYVGLPFDERGHSYASVLAMRDAKYKQYAARAAACATNIVGVRYEDLAADPAFLFDALHESGLACATRAAFVAATNHAKFGVETAAAHEDATHVWSAVEWAAVRARVDSAFDATLGYGYGPTPGSAAVGPVPAPTWLTVPPPAPPS